MRRRLAAWLSSLAVLCVAWGCGTSAPPASSSTDGAAGSSSSATDGADATAPLHGETNPHATSPDAAAGTPEKTDTAGGELDLDEVRFTVPEGWSNKGAGNAFVAAEFALPKAEGDDADGRLTVSFAGGTIEANAERWRGQFGGKPTAESTNELEAGDLKITVIDFSGEFDDSRGPFARGAKKADYRMIGAMIPIEQDRMCFVKATGPAKTIAAHSRKIIDFVSSVKKP